MPETEFLGYYVAQGGFAGSLSSPDGADNGDFIGGTYHSVTFHAAIDPLLPPSVPVFIQIYTDLFGTGLAKLSVVKGDVLDHFDVIAEKDTVVQGESVKISVVAKDENNNTVNIEDETPLDFSLDDAGASLGKLVTPDGRLTLIAYASVRDLGTTILAFVANEAPLPALATATRTATNLIASTPSAGAAQVTEDPPTVIGVATINVKKTTDPRKKGSGIVTVKKPRFPTTIELTVSSDQVQHSETIVLKVNLRDRDGLIPPGDGVWGINFFLGAEGVQFGNLNNTATGADAVKLNDVAYKQASDGSITFVADGAAYDGRFPLGISLGASVDVNGKVYTDVKGIYLTGANTTGERFTQGDPAWKDSLYDASETVTIGDKGCALTAMAIVLKAFGSEGNPGELNSYMQDNGKFNGLGVVWDAVTGFSDGKIVVSTYDGKGVGKGQPLNLTGLDGPLSNGSAVVAQVFNASTGNEHWVVVTGKQNNEYTILDPGGYGSRTTLSAYENQIYKYVVYTIK